MTTLQQQQIDLQNQINTLISQGPPVQGNILLDVIVSDKPTPVIYAKIYGDPKGQLLDDTIQLYVLQKQLFKINEQLGIYISSI